jgi:large subunit ribosomal protein L10
MKKRSDKKKEAQALHGELQGAYHVFVTSFEKITVAQDFELRKAIRGAGGRYRVIKNNLAAKAAEGTPSEGLLQGLQGMTSLAYTAADPVALARTLTSYAKTNPTFTFKAGMVEGRVIDVRAIGDLANMPSKEQLIGKVMWLINSSAQRLAGGLNGVARNLAAVLDQAVKENKFNA